MEEKYWNYILIALILLLLWWVFIKNDNSEGFGALTADQCRSQYVGTYGGYVSVGGSRDKLAQGKAKYDQNSCSDATGNTWDQERERYQRFAIGKDVYFSEKLQQYIDAPDDQKTAVVGKILGEMGTDYSQYVPPVPATVSVDSSGEAVVSEDEVSKLQSDLESLESSVEELLQSVSSTQSVITGFDSSAEEMASFGSELESLEEQVKELVGQQSTAGTSFANTWGKGWFVSAFTLKQF